MGQRDAFGREIGEDPLVGMGWTPPAPVPPAPAHAPANIVREPFWWL
jgi:hypothetical protein